MLFTCVLYTFMPGSSLHGVNSHGGIFTAASYQEGPSGALYLHLPWIFKYRLEEF
jgi:hypothetical protein